MSAGEMDGAVATVQLDAGQTPVDVVAIRQAVAAGGPSFFPRHRWFGDKAREITESRLIAVVYSETRSEATYPLALTVIEVVFEDGGRERYFVPLTIVSGGTISTRSLARLSGPGDETFTLDDAVALPEFHRWLLDPAARSTADQNPGRIEWRPGPNFGSVLTGLGDAASRVSGAEQSNSAVIFGTVLLAKVFRRLRPGMNPDIEISRFLSAQAGFRNFPELLGDLTYETGADDSYSIGMTQPFIPNYGDGWSNTLAILRDMLLGGACADAAAPFLLLGTRTGELHQALATRTDDDAFAAESITPADIEGWTDALASSFARTLEAVRSRSDQLPIAWRNRLANLTVADPAVVSRIESFRHLEGVDKIRVHGDYHLGQVLVTLDHDFVILDFEGEPSRPMDERRAKTSPLKDVAGMLRSFSYARYAALRARPNEIPEAEAAARLMEWELAARNAFLSGYRSATADQGATFLPLDKTGFAAALSAWSLDKAIYEVNYEINNRPDWLPLPLEALLTAES